MSAQIDGLRYSEAALAVRDLFSQGQVEYFFYVEDEEQENLYELIIGKCFPRIGAAKVFPLGGKPNVINHAKQNALHARHRIYIVDKDFDDLLGRIESVPGLHYLDDYCIETALVEEASIVELVVEEMPRKKRAAIMGGIAFTRTMSEWMPLLDALHRAFFLVQMNDLPLKNCDMAPEAFCQKGSPSKLSEEMVREYQRKVADALVAKGVLAEVNGYAELSRKAFNSARQNICHINGKFVQKLWYHRLKSLGLVSNLTQDSMTIRLARHSKLRRLKSVRRRIAAGHL